MNIDYAMSVYKIGSLRSKLIEILKDGESVSYEDKIAYKSLCALIENLEKCENTINYYSQPVIEGMLKKKKNGYYVLVTNDGREVQEFTCGCGIECYILRDGDEECGEWFSGRVEFSHSKEKSENGFYFYNPDGKSIMLKEGIKARIRLRE